MRITTKRRTPVLQIGAITVRLLTRGDEYPCPTKGHPPFTHERADPAVALYRGTDLLRVVPVAALAKAHPGVFRGQLGGLWSLTPQDVRKIADWAAKPGPPGTPRPAVTKVASSVWANVRVPQGREGGPLRPKAHTHPKQAKELLADCDYRHQLSPQERAGLDQFQRETVLNRWYDGETEPFYARGSEARRKLQFAYNRRVDDIVGHKDSFPVDIDARGTGHLGGTDRGGRNGTVSMIDTFPASAPTEDDLIDAIDRSRE